MEELLPPPNSIVCVDNTIVFKAVYNPYSIVTDLFLELILERSCTLCSTEFNLQRCREAVERKLLPLCKRLLNNKDFERLKQYFSESDNVQEEELIEQVKGFVFQRLEFVSSFLEVFEFRFYSDYISDAISILKDPDDEEDAYILALALALHKESDSPVYFWTDDTDFYNVEEVLKEYNIRPFKRVR